MKGIDTHSIMLPEFQRDFRWELNKTYDLFDSLIKDIFIGTIIYGKPAFELTLRAIDTRPRKGKGSTLPLKLQYYSKEEITKQALTSNLRIVLDGQQRITSIYRAITGIDHVFILLHEHLSAETIHKLSLEDMVQEVKGEESSAAISVKLSDAYKANDEGMLDEELKSIFMQTLYARTTLKNTDKAHQDAAFKVYRRAIQLLIKLYQQEKLVAYYLLDMSLSKFCTFFERSNSRSIQLSFIDILAAKLYHGFNVRNKIDEFENQHPSIKLNREIIVRTIAYVVGERRGTIDIDRNFILEHLNAHDFQTHWDATCKLYIDCLTYLAHQHYILSQAWMPSENMIIPLMIFLRHIQSFDRMREAQRKFIEYWYWSSVFANRYTVSSNETIITDCGALSLVARNERVTARNYFTRMRPLITEADDLFIYTKKSSTIYRGVLNLLAYASQGLRDWNSTHEIDISMSLEDHHIYPRAFIASKPQMVGIDQNEAEQLVDCVVNRTLIPKILNIQIGKKAPVEYLAELQQKNPGLVTCLPSHLMPTDMITDSTWNTHFKLFLTERTERIFDLIKHYTTEATAGMIQSFGSQVESSQSIPITMKPRLKDLIANGKVFVGDKIYVRKDPHRTANIVDGDTVEFEGKYVTINMWGQQITGWTSINIYNYVILERTGETLEKIRERI